MRSIPNPSRVCHFVDDFGTEKALSPQGQDNEVDAVDVGIDVTSAVAPHVCAAVTKLVLSRPKWAMSICDASLGSGASSSESKRLRRPSSHASTTTWPWRQPSTK